MLFLGKSCQEQEQEQEQEIEIEKFADLGRIESEYCLFEDCHVMSTCLLAFNPMFV